MFFHNLVKKKTHILHFVSIIFYRYAIIFFGENMEYKFYGFNTKAIKPINKEYEKIIDQRHLYDILKTIWSKETCAPRMQDRWSKDNYTLGQCSITSFLVQDIFGGDVYGILLDDGNYHCYNVIGDIIFDLTYSIYCFNLYTLHY